jgi:glycine cleavage system H protein
LRIETIMSEIPPELRYARTHEWVRALADGNIEMGISDHAQHALGDLVFVELPEVGRTLAAGEACAVVESVKAASDVYCPVAGTVVAVNERLAAAPELVNQQPYADGWLLRLRPTGALADAGLLDARGYAAVAVES